MTRTIATATLMAALMLMTAACDERRVYDHYEHADPGGWEKNETLEFGIDSLKDSGTYSMLISLRLSDRYPFKNLHIVVDQTVYPSRTAIHDTVTCHVTDDRGMTLGAGISLYQYTLPVRKRFYMHGDSIHVRVRHNMKREILPGIADVGIQLKAE
ncbi:MAG: gliding motility lipoprotein GldH [Prevotella sp.]